MTRAVPLIAVLIVSACSRTPAQARTTETPVQGPAAEASQPVKPVPAVLPDVLARVNGEAIGKAEFERQLRSIEARAGGPVPAGQRDAVYRGLLDQIIAYRLLIQESRARNVTVPDEEVDARVNQIKSQFPSEEVFTQLLAQQKLTIEQLKADARTDMAVAKMINDEVAARSTVTAEQVESFYRENPDQFKQAARVRASHILIGVPQGADAAVRTQARARAEQVLALVKAGGDFAALAREHSEDPGSAARGGDLGYFTEGQMVGPFNEAAFSLPVGQTSGLVETQFGFHIIRVADRQPSRTVPLEEVRPQVETFLTEQHRRAETEKFVNGLKAKGKIELFI